MADSTPNHFFKFISPGSKFNLSIPSCFWTKLSGEGRDKPILRRGCREWPVDISDTGVFGDGWRKFVEDNGVQEFDFVVFKHQGNLVFDFIVFDQSLCERQYPEMNVDDHITESDSIHTFERSKKRYSSENIDKFQLDDHCSFVSKMTPTNIRSSRVHVPMEFARSNGLITESTHTEIVVMDEAQRTWPATLKLTKAQSSLMGWRELRIQNHIQVGDSCMFKLVKHAEAAVFHIYNLGKKPVENHIQVKNEGTSTSNLKNHRYFTSTLKPKDDRPDYIGQVKSYKKDNFPCNDDTCFVTTMTPYYIRSSRLAVPIRFSRSNGLIVKRKQNQTAHTKIVLMDEEQRTWPATLKVGTIPIRLTVPLTDWRKLIKKNHIQSGDSYLGKKPVQVKETSSTHIYTDLEKKPIQVKETSSTRNHHPYFISTLKPCTFNKLCLYLPVDFSIPNGLKTGKAILTDNKRRSWD
uniref:B3 domain-containing protein REM5-like n=1 Tax=Erigeron canadensis TaxID=72917 RepID=UPI001CB8D5A2